MPRRFHLHRFASLVAVVVAASTSACSTAGSAVATTATAAAAGVEAVVATGEGVATTILPLGGPTGFDAQRAKMEESAGPAHYQNDDLKAGKAAMVAKSADFAAHRRQFVSPQFQEARAKLRAGSTRPNAGPVLGAAAGAALRDPDLARALLGAAAASQGVPVLPVQPVLAQLLPAFGN